MPEHTFEEARFDHVSDAGELVFVLGAQKFVINVDEALERAILEAKQIQSETRKDRQPNPSASLPISQIQALIRAGAEPARVAERYALSEALVRRFSAAVETEKQYAIEQFLAVPAPKESRVRTLSELIERTFAAARIRLEDVTWKATRRGLEPWKITARFVSEGHKVSAEWSWNMHDNAVTCLNAAARKLVGERETPKSGNAEQRVDEAYLTSLNLPGNSARSARIEQTVSAWNAPEPTMPAVRPSGATSETVPSPTDAIVPRTTPETDAGTTSSEPVSAERSADSTDSAGLDRTQVINADSAASAASANAASGDSQGSVVDSGQEKTGDRSSVPGNAHSQNSTKSKRRAGRSAVPSWDEILFGD